MTQRCNSLNQIRFFITGILISVFGAAVFGQTPSEARKLHLNQLSELQIKGGETQLFVFSLKAGEYARTEVEQKNIDVTVSLFSSDGTLVVEMDGRKGKLWRESVSHGAEKPEEVTLKVKAISSPEVVGSYKVRLTEIRQTTPLERKRIQAERLLSEALQLHEQGKPKRDQAINSYQSSAVLWNELGESFWEGVTAYNLGLIYRSAMNFEKTGEYFTKALALFRSGKDRRGEATTLNLLGRNYYALNQFDQALEHFEQALRIFRQLEDRSAEVAALNNIGGVYDALAQYGQAIAYYEPALKSARLSKNRLQEVTIGLNLGRIYSSLNQPKKALALYEQSLVIARETKNRIQESIALYYLAGIYGDLRQYEKSILYHEQTLTMARQANDLAGISGVLPNLATDYAALKQYDKALKYAEESLASLRGVNNRFAEAQTYYILGYIHHKTNQPEKALENYTRALRIWTELRDRDAQASLLYSLMNLWNESEKPSIAVFFGKQAVNAYQEVRANISGLDKNTRGTFLKSVEHVYQQLAEILISEGRFNEAQKVLALLKEEEYFEYVRRDSNEIKNLKARADLKADEQKLIERYNQLSERLTDIGTEFQKLDEKKRRLPEGASLPAEEQKRYDELNAMLTDANAAFRLFLEKELVAELGQTVKKEIEIDRALQNKLRQWGEGTVAIYTLTGENRYRLILTTPTVQKAGKTEIKAADLNKKIFAFREILQNPNLDPRPAGKELYDILIKPIERDLQGAKAKTLLWSLDGTLRYIPIAALWDGKQYLAEKYQTVVITSTTRQSLLAETKKDWRALGLGVSSAQTVQDPILPNEKISFSALPGVKAELNVIVQDEQTPADAGLLTGKRFLDENFSVKNFSDSLTKETEQGKRKYTVVHIASHFRLGGDSKNSFLLLGDGNVLTLEQISDSPEMTFEDVELVTLSACNTAFGEDSTGKEVDSLATFIELRGAKAVIASLWAVADDSTQLLMGEFYRLGKENPDLNKAEALRQAQKSMLEGKLKPSVGRNQKRAEIVDKENNAKAPRFNYDAKKPFAHPYYWSSFVLIGNWR